MDKRSPAYYRALEQAKAHHASSKTYSGKFLRPHAAFIKHQLIDRLYLKSILDFGCGKGYQYSWVSHGNDNVPAGLTLEQFWGTPVRRYDPAVDEFSIPPQFGQQFDLVLCTHVLGSIPVIDLPDVLREIFERSARVVYIAEKLGPVRKQVFTNSKDMPRNWDRARWQAELQTALARYRPHVEEVWLSTRELQADGQVINQRGTVS